MTHNGFQTSSRRLFISCLKTKQAFLIDTGSDESVFPRSWCHHKCIPATHQLFAANGSVINSYGTISRILDFGLRRSFEWNFLIADVTTAILGADFLCHYDLIVDLKRGFIKDGITSFRAPVSVRQCMGPPSVKTIIGDSRYHLLLASFPLLTAPGKLNKTTKCHNTKHHIVTTEGPPLSSRARRLAPDRLKIARQEFNKMIELGLARPSSSPWSSPLYLVPKKNGDWHPCGDFRRLNARTIPDKYPIRLLIAFSFGLHSISPMSMYI